MLVCQGSFHVIALSQIIVRHGTLDSIQTTHLRLQLCDLIVQAVPLRAVTLAFGSLILQWIIGSHTSEDIKPNYSLRPYRLWGSELVNGPPLPATVKLVFLSKLTAAPARGNSGSTSAVVRQLSRRVFRSNSPLGLL